MTKSINVFIELQTDEQLPHRASEYSAAYDLRSSHAVAIGPGVTIAIPTGIKLAIPPGFEAEIRPRSGLSLKSRLRLANSPGTIDADFRGELKVIMHNDFCQREIPSLIAQKSPLLDRFGPIVDQVSLRDYLKGQADKSELLLEDDIMFESLSEAYLYMNAQGDLWGTEYILAQERIAQILIKPLSKTNYIKVDSVQDIGEDRGGGFGHSGRV